MYADAGGLLPRTVTECTHLVTTNSYLEVIKTHMHSVRKPVNCLGKHTWILDGEFCLRTTHWKRCCLTIILKTRKVGLDRRGIASRTHLVSWHLSGLNLNTSIWKFRGRIYVAEGASGICLNLGHLTQNDGFQVYPFTCEFHAFIFYTRTLFHWDYVAHVLSIRQLTIVTEEEGAKMSKRLCRRRSSLWEHA